MSFGARLRAGLQHAALLGALAGTFESVGLALRLKLELGALAMAGVAAVATLTQAGVGLLAGLLCAFLLYKDPEAPAWRCRADHLGGSTFLLVGFYLWQAAWELYAQGSPQAAAAMAMMPLGFAGIVLFNARYWLRRSEAGPVAVPFWRVIGGAVLLGWVVASIVHPLRPRGGGQALPSDPNLLLITVDGLRAEDAPDGGPGSVRFTTAISPTNRPAASNATVLTGLHPVYHRLWQAEGSLTPAVRTLPEWIGGEGYRTAAFVSRGQLADLRGFGQGFGVFDDDLGWLPGVDRVNLWWRVGGLLRHLAGEEPRRSPQATLTRFRRWHDRAGEQAWFAWLHLEIPEATDPASYAAGRDAARAAWQEALALASSGSSDRGRELVWVLAGTHGQSLGEGGHTGRHTLYDPVVRVPLVLHLGPELARVGEVPAQVRLMDVAPTLMDTLQLTVPTSMEGYSLLEFARGERLAPMWCPLLGDGPAGQVWFGQRNNGLKVLEVQGQLRIYDLEEDPLELTDRASELGSVAEAARDLLAPYRAAWKSLEGAP